MIISGVEPCGHDVLFVLDDAIGTTDEPTPTWLNHSRWHQGSFSAFFSDGLLPTARVKTASGQV